MLAAAAATPTPAPTDNLLLLSRLLSASPSPGPSDPFQICHQDGFCHVRCLNNCPQANDGLCDDGGTGSFYASCELGHDCEDCDRRMVYAPPLPPWSPPSPPYPPVPPTAPYAFYYNPLDPHGSEPAEIVPCVKRGKPGYEDIHVIACTDSCFVSRYGLGMSFTSDGVCDDGIGTKWGGACPVGTDCADCGRRCLKVRPASPSPPSLPPQPAPPGSSYVPTLAFTVTVAGTVEAFDEPDYKAKMASVLGNGITAADISLTLKQGSVIVTTRVRAPSTSVATSLKKTIESASVSSLTAALGITVTDLSKATVELALVDGSAQLDEASSTASLALADAQAQQRSLMTIAIILGVALLVVITAIACACWLRGKCGAQHRRTSRLPRFRQSGRARVVTRARNCGFTEHSIVSPSSRFKADEFSEHSMISASSGVDDAGNVLHLELHDGDDAL